MTFANSDIDRRMALNTIQAGVVRLQWLRDATRFEIAMHRHALALKYGYDPAQPRVPKHNDGGGRWVYAGGGSQRAGSDGLVQLAGDIPTGDSPEVPKERPPTPKERTKALKAASRYGGSIGKLIDAVKWLRDQSPIIQSYRDPARTLEELQRNVSEGGLGYDIHHIVERTQARVDGFSPKLVDAPENLVRIPRMKHWEINGWYQKANPEFGGETPRQYLNGRSWAVKRNVGLEALRKFGVLKP
jgi:hypothetical protein